MLRIKLTEKAISKLRAPTESGRQILFWDEGHKEALRGFGVLCSGKTSSKTYVAQRDMPNGKTRRVTIAGVNEMSLVEARRRAADVLVQLRRGVDLKAKVTCSTLRQTLEAYQRGRNDLRPRSLEN